MRLAIAIGQRWEKRWKRATGAALTFALLSAVAVAGITLLGSEVFAALKTPGNAEQALSSGGVFAGLLNFEAPAQTRSRVKVQAAEAQQSIRRTSNVSLFVQNWKFTQLPIADQLLQSLGQFLMAYETAVANSINQMTQIAAADFSALTSLINAALTAYGNLVTSFAQAIANVLQTTNITNVSNSTSNSHSASPFQ